ncbi:MAG: undecaprenyl/decaprenyl-phosphate alpha-N-acetylglucosaminyl 1-phosphate transferase [Candidatus Andersenbacteria bacterium]|nr:undecaprenyl/decaprenyl-phosphate alpha-N-acetylglucosaminyl 1-phosphate transferase [Candidatus Andersenbacteria bacterium]
MIFDTTIVTPGHAVLGGVLFCITNLALFLFIRSRIKSFSVYGMRGTYYAGWVLATVVSVAAVFQLTSFRMAIGLLIAAACIIAFGTIDEKKNLPAWEQLAMQAFIVCIVMYFGWRIPYVTNIFHGGIVFLGVVLGSVFTFLWVLACMNAVNFLDGTDGLAPAVTAIACIALAGISLLPATQDAQTFVLAIIGFAGIAGFFVWNAPPARVYLGTTGSWFIGLYVALVAMIGGGKISTTLIVLAIPMLDALFVVAYRTYMRKFPWTGDTVSHLHHRLSRAGLGKWSIVFYCSAGTVILGYIGVVASTNTKIIAFGIIALLFFIASARMMKRVSL